MKQQKFCFSARMLFLVMGLMLSLATFAQSIKGTVKDATGEAIIGATVQVAGQAGTGTVTDFDGNFELKVKPGTQLQFSYVGMQTQTLPAADGMVVTMKDDSQMLDQVVVIGYGVAKKNDLTGSVTAIKPDEKNHGLQTSAQDMLQGKVAGVNIVNSGGSAGGSSTIRIRGGSSLNASNDPLIVIDGLAMDSYGRSGSSNFLSSINPNDIESFTVLKDASATAIYGSRASNGVIIITTKKGRKGSAPKVTYNANISISTPRDYVKVMDSSTFQNYVNTHYSLDDAAKSNLGYWSDYNADGTPAAGAQHLYADTDWQREIYRTAVSTDHNVSVTGGLKNMPYRVSLGYTDQNGILQKNNYQRFTGSFNLSPSLLKDHLTFNINGKYMYSKTDYSNQSAIGQAISYDPTKPVYSNTAFYNKYWGGYYQYSHSYDRGDNTYTFGPNTYAVANPVASIYQKSDIGKQNSLIGNFEVDYKIHGLEDLHVHMNAGIDYESGRNEYSYPYDVNNYCNSWDNNYYGSTGWSEMQTTNLSFNAYVQYMHDWGKKGEVAIHSLNVMAGYEYQRFHKRTDYDSFQYYPLTNVTIDDQGNPYAGQRLNTPTNTVYKTENYLVSFFGRLNYTLLERYLFTFTLRDDGSSRFASDERWGVFPSAAFAWKINDEAFLKDHKTISDLKLRLGWGMTGQQDFYDNGNFYADYGYLPTYKDTQNNMAYYNIGIANGLTQRPVAYNTKLTWEKTTTWNAGIDFGIMNQRFTSSLDFYYRKTTDLINTVIIPVGTNFSNKLTSNIGSLHNMGIEFSMQGDIIRKKDWTWNVSYNLTWNKNEIDELVASNGDDYKILHGGIPVGDSSTDGVQAYHVGEAASAYYVYQQVYDANGQPIEGCYVDRNGDGTINASDRYYYKKADPDVTMGLATKLTYKNWDLGLTFRASFNNYVYNAVEALHANYSYTSIYSGESWHNILDMDVNKNWQSNGASDVLSDYFIQNASFLKLDNVTIGYSFENLLKGAKYHGLSGRVYGTVQNVFTITKYKGLDPEVSGGYDSSIYPRPLTVILGLSLNF